MSTRTTGISELGRLLSNVFGWGSRSAGSVIRAADDVAEAGAKAGFKAVPLEISEKGLKAAGVAAAEKALKASGSIGFRKASEGRLSSRAETAMSDYVKNAARENYSPFLNKANEALEDAVKSGKASDIKRAEHEIAKIEGQISKDAGAYLSKHADEISGMADKIGYKVKNGSAGYRYTVGYAGRNPVKTIAVGAATAGAVGLYSGVASTVETLKNLTPDGIGETLGKTFNAAMSGMGSVGGFGLGKLGSVFNAATDGLEYMGIDPTLAKGVVGLGTFFALKSALDLVAEQTGFNKIMPGVGLGVIIAAGVLAYKIAEAADDKDATYKPEATAALSAPAPAMP